MDKHRLQYIVLRDGVSGMFRESETFLREDGTPRIHQVFGVSPNSPVPRGPVEESSLEAI